MSILESARKASGREKKKYEDTKPSSTKTTTKESTTQKSTTTSTKKNSSILDSARKATGRERQSGANYSSAPSLVNPNKKYTDFNSETKNAYTTVKNKLNNTTTISNGMTEDERKKRIDEINAELVTLNRKLSGYSRAKAYVSGDALEKAEKKDKERIAELTQERKTLERVGTFTDSELKQFEIEDAKAKESALRQKSAAYGPRPSASEAESWRETQSDLYNARQEVEELERQKELYDDIAKFGDVVNEDNFGGQWRANYRSNELSREADKAMTRYLDNPTQENMEIAYAYDAFVKEYAKNNKKALDDKNVTASWLTKSMAGYLPQFKDQIVPELIGGGVGLILGSAVGAPNVGASVGSGLASGAQSYNVMRGSVYRTLRAEGVDEETALQAANDEALISSLIEGGETALSWLLAGGGKAISAISGAAKASVAKGSTNVATKFVANLGAKATAKATTKAATKAAAEVSKPLWRKGVRMVGGVALQGGTEYLEEFTQGAVSKANQERALATVEKEIGQYGEGNIDLYNRPIYKNADGTISTVDSVTFQVDDKFVVLPTIVKDENGKPKRLESDEEIWAHYEKTGEYLGEFDTLDESNAYANKLHTAQAYYYGDKTVKPDDNLVGGGGKVIFDAFRDAIVDRDTETLAELHAQGWEGAKIGLMFGGSNAIVNNIVSHYANAKTVQMQNEIADTIIEDEESLNALIEEGKASGEGTVSAKIAEEVEQAREKGNVTREQVKRLIASNEVYIKEEEKTNAPDTLEQAAMDVVASRNATQTAEIEPVANVFDTEGSLPAQDEKTFTAYRMNSVLGDGERSVGIADGQAFVTNSKDINPSPTNRSVFLPVNDTEVARAEFGATESNKTSADVSKILASDFVPVRENYVDGTLKGVGEVRVFTDENGREIAIETNVAEYFEGYNLEATFRGGKPYAIKATDNDGKVVGVAMAVWQDKSGQKYELTETYTQTQSNAPYNVMSNENPMLQERQARESYIQKATGYGRYGVRAFADIMETVSENEAPVVAKAFRSAYEAGLTNLDTVQAKLPTAVHRIAFNAGKQDYIMENVGKEENVKNVKSHGDKAGFDSTNAPSNVSKKAIDIVDRFCKELGVTARMTGDSDMYNANITPNVGVVRIARNFSVLEHLGEDAASLSFVTHALHEVADHRAEELAPTEYAEFKREMYNYKNSLDGVSLADAKRQEYGKRGVDISLSEAMSEVTANSILEIYDNDLDLLAEGLDRVLNGTNEKAKKGANVFKQALDYVIEKFKKLLNKFGVETKQKYKASSDEVIKVRDAFEKSLGAAIAKNKEIAKSSNLVTEKNGTIVDAKGNIVAQINEDGTASFSLKTFDDTGRAELQKWLDKNVKNKKLTEAEAKDISDQLEYFYDICKEYEDKYAPFSAWSKAEVVKGLDGKPLMSVVKANGDYKMNLDFSLVCKKRRPLDALYRAMIDDGFMDNIGQLSEVEVARINEIIRKNGFETACTLCFVDSKRYRQYAVADSFVSKYNELVKMLAPEGAKIDRFDFSGRREASADGLHTMSNEELKKGINKLNKVIKEHGESTVVGKIANHLKAVPKDRKLVMVSDFMDSEGFVRVKKANPSVFKLYNSSKGSGGPKATLPDVQYLGEILKRSNFTPKKAYDVGGVRVQSFSDYIPRLVFDYLQMTADLSAKKLPAHAYSKEDIFVMQFGKTGIKINMSLVPAVAKDGIAPGLDKDGNYVWVDGHTFASDFHDKGSGQRGFELAVKIQNTEGYSQNCGTIAVGVSDEHIIKMLKDNDIRMVIPYHKSSLNHFVAKMGNIDQYKNYTNVQNTRDKATDKKIEGKDFNFNEAFHRLGDAKAATKEYLAWCDENNYIPKFDTFAFHEDAEVRENYYKVLIDFAAYDSDGNSIPQRAVTMNFPTENDAFGSMKSLIEKGLEADAILEGRKAENIPKILKDIEYLELAKEPKKNEARLREMVDEAARNSMPNSKITTKDGKLRIVFHGTNTGDFTVFNPDYIGMSSGDDGFFGMGFYFAYSEGEASYYGAKRIIPAYLDLKNPFNFDKELQTYKGKKAASGYAPDAVAFMNFADKFPDIAKNITVDVVEKGSDTYKELSLADFSKAFKDVIDNKKFEYQEQANEFGEKETLVLADPQIHEYEYNGEKHKYKDYGFQKRFWGKPNDLDVAYEYLANTVYSHIDMYNKTRLILDNNREFTNALKNMGYDGTIQSEFGDEAVAFSSEQIKSADLVTYDNKGNVIPLSERFNTKNDDIRYSLKDSEGNTLTKEQQEYFKDSKVRDENGNLLVVYHGSPAKFTVFDHYHINKRGNSHGRGFYFTEKKSLAEGYEGAGGQLLKGYLNITKPLSEDKKTMKKADLLKLIKATCEAEARMIVEDGGYDNVREALRDTWVSNCVNTYEMSMDSAYREVLNIFWNGNDNDVELISDLTNSGAGNENVLRQVHDVLGYDGVIYTAPDGTHEFVSLVSEQFKNIDNTNPTSNPDINYSLKGTERDISLKDVPKVRKAVSDRNADVLAKYVDSGAISTEVYNQLIEEFGAIPKGEKPYRDVQVPSKTAKDKKVSQTVRTILEAQATPDEAVPTIEKMVEDGIFSYDVYTDKQAIADSEAYIKEYGWDESLDDWFDAVNKGEVSKDLTAMGWALYNNAANIAATTTSETERTTAIKTSLKILDAMVRHQRSAAQALQATRILKKLSPETQLYGVQKSVQALQNELTEKYGDKAPDLKIDEELTEQFINAKTPEERAEVEKKIYKDIGRQMPSRLIDKWNAWRYLAMLGNLRTHIRNIGGNAGFAPIVATKNLTATAIESVVYRVSGKKTLRGKALIIGSKADRALLKAAWGDYSNVADLISNGGKYNDSAMANQKIEEGRAIFTSKNRVLRGAMKPLEWARKGNSKALETEDMWFSKPHYAYALAQYCKANNITADQIKRGKAIAPARDYAIKEAQKATYRDTNAFSQMVSEWGRNKAEKNVVKKAFNTVVEGILPFRKTPANILVRGVEYSPLGLIKGLSYDLYQVSKGKMSATTAIDNISAGLTGTGLLALGVYLAAQGLIRGHGEDDEEKKFKELMGHQSYSLELPNGQSITLDWLAPEALPFFVGVNYWENTKGTDEEANLSTILKSVSNISEPMLEMSCLQGLNDLFEGIGYASSNDTSGLVSIVSSAITSYLTQGIPTLAGQAERTGEENRMTTYTEKNDFLTGDMQYTLGKASAKIPFWDYNQIPYIDAWGRKEASGTALKRGLNNFLNPAYTSTVETSSMEKELLRLYEKTGEGGVFPERADKYFTVDGKRKDLTAEEYVRYATLKGQKSYKLVSDLVKSKAYKKLSNEEKAKAVREVYDYANQKAKEAISKYKPEAWVAKADEFGSNVGNYISFKTEVSGTREDNGGKISKQEVVDIVLDMAQNDSETWKMYLSMYDSDNDLYAYNNGIDGETYMHFLEALDDVDEPTKSGKYGTYTQAEAKRAVNTLSGLSREEKSILWQSVNTTWKKNPF